jgi:hypothetical protein
MSILGFAFMITLGALFQGKTTRWEGVPEAVSVVVFFILISVVGMLEGMQIAFFAVAKLTKEERGSSPFAMKTCELLFRGEGRNLPGFMIGRQLLVVSCMFIVARISSLDVDVDAVDETIFGVPTACKTSSTPVYSALYRNDHWVCYMMAACGVGLPYRLFVRPVGLRLSPRMPVVGVYWYLQRGMGSRCDSQENCWLPSRRGLHWNRGGTSQEQHAGS